MFVGRTGFRERHFRTFLGRSVGFRRRTNAALVHRDPLCLTEIGNLVLGYAESIFSLGSELMATVRGGEGQRVQQLRVGAVATLSRNFQQNFLRPVIGLEPIQLVLESASLEDLLERLRVHKLDLILSNRPVTADAQPSTRSA